MATSDGRLIILDVLVGRLIDDNKLHVYLTIPMVVIPKGASRGVMKGKESSNRLRRQPILFGSARNSRRARRASAGAYALLFDARRHRQNQGVARLDDHLPSGNQRRFHRDVGR